MAYSFLQKFIDFSIVFYKILYIFLQTLWDLQFSVKLYRKLQIFYSMQGVYSFLKNILQKNYRFFYRCYGPIVFYRKFYRKVQILQKTIIFSIDFIGPIVFYRKLQVYKEYFIENYRFVYRLYGAYSFLQKSVDYFRIQKAYGFLLYIVIFIVIASQKVK